MRRRLPILPAASLALCIATSALWIRSNGTADALIWKHATGRMLGFVSHAGSIVVCREVEVGDGRGLAKPGLNHLTLATTPAFVTFPPNGTAGGNWRWLSLHEFDHRDRLEWIDWGPPETVEARVLRTHWSFAGFGWRTGGVASLDAEQYTGVFGQSAATMRLLASADVQGWRRYLQQPATGVLVPDCWFLKLPLWQLFTASVLLPAAWLRRVIREARRPPKGLCPSCGYDLRATLERCPECGAVSSKV